MYKIKLTARFKRDYRRALKQGRKMDVLEKAVSILADGGKLPAEYRDHALTGSYTGYRECHIEPDWLLIYKILDGTLVLVLYRTGSHSDLFR